MLRPTLKTWSVGWCFANHSRTIAGSTHTVRLHFAEPFFTKSGSRTFNVSINGTTVLTNFDIFATTGAIYKALVEQFTLPASPTGDYVITFSSVINQSLVNGIEIQ